MAFFSFQTAFSQVIDRPIRDSEFICANNNSPIFEFTSGYTANEFTDTNIFSLELSNPDGTYPSENPNLIADLPTDNSRTGFVELRFIVNISEIFDPFEGSDFYRLRVRASDEVPPSQSFSTAIHYVDVSNLFAGLDTEPSILCSNSNDRTIRAIPDDLSGYLWYRREPGDVSSFGELIPEETSNTLEVNDIGNYFFRVDIGECTGLNNDTSRIATSNFTEVQQSNGIDVSILDNSTRVVCSDETVTFESSEDDPTFFYRWFKDGVQVLDINTDNLVVTGSSTSVLTVSGIDSEGSYSVSVAASQIGDCTTQSVPVDVELRNPRINITSEATVILIPPGEPKVLTAEIVRGTNPEITWFRDGTIIPDSNTTELEVTQSGLYTVALTADSPCPEDNTVFAEGSVLVLPAENLTITIDYSDPATYEDCELDEVTLEVTQVTANVDGQNTILEGAALDGLQVDWLQDGVSTGETDGSILINSASGNGTYTASIQAGTEAASVSNSLPVILALDSFEITRNPQILALGETVELSLGLEDETGYTFRWLRNTSEVLTESTSSTIVVDQPGLYSVEVSFDVCGTETVGPVSLNSGSAEIPNVITPNGDGINDDWVLTGDLTLNQAVEVNIYTTTGELDFSSTNYNGEWPNESSSNGIGTIYYYVINRDNSLVEQGSITIIR